MGSYLKLNRHGTVFYFRRRVPDDLRRVLGRRFLVKTLGAAGRREAIILARALASRTDVFFHHLRTMPNHDEKIQVDLIFKLDFNDLGGLKSVHIEAETPEEHEQAKAMLNDTLDKIPVNSNDIARKKPGMSFSGAMEAYLELQKKASTRGTYRSRLKHALAYFGAEKDIRHIEQAELSRYAKFVNQDVADSSTAGFYITTFCGLLNHFRLTEGWGGKLTTERLIEKAETPDSEARDAFSSVQLKALLINAAKYRAKEPHKYWVTVAMPFLGCRIEELAQVNLHTDLLRSEVAKVWYLDVNAKADSDGLKRKSVKNKASWRCIPIHSALVRHGFVDYLIEQRKKGFSRPFESGWKPAEFDNGAALKWSHYITNWGGRELKKLVSDGIIADEERKLAYFHSMRLHSLGAWGEREFRQS
ncbi:MAG: hypothetical protein H6R16_434 [Proteobacteria bacterium]|nr:hypothetical protein [Pseudomonadota bacterium]